MAIRRGREAEQAPEPVAEAEPESEPEAEIVAEEAPPEENTGENEEEGVSAHDVADPPSSLVKTSSDFDIGWSICKIGGRSSQQRKGHPGQRIRDA
jgi:hypothetical protein